jgi:hypothetical protein
MASAASAVAAHVWQVGYLNCSVASLGRQIGLGDNATLLFARDDC